MAKVKHISEAMIRGQARVLDYYYWRGIPVCRRWPVWHNKPRSPAVQASAEAFRQSRRDLKAMTPIIRESYRRLNVGKKMAWVDMYTRAYMWNYKASGGPVGVLTNARRWYPT